MTISRVRIFMATVTAMASILLSFPLTAESGDKGNDKKIEKKFEKGKNNLEGRARWNWTLTDNGTKVDQGTFMGYVDGKISFGKNKKEVGSWKKVGPKTITATFSWPKLAGTWTFVQTKANPPTYDGKEAKGSRKIHLEIIND